jgi:hypothetical protein
VWKDNAIFVDPTNPVLLKKVINSLIHDEVLRQTYAARAQHHARKFTAGKMAENYMQLYQQVLSQERKSKTNSVIVANAPASASFQQFDRGAHAAPSISVARGV